MEFTIHWFWVLKAVPVVLLGIFLYSYTSRKCSRHRLYCWLLITTLVFSALTASTIKLKVEPVTASQTKAIEATKGTPEKVEGTEFKHKVIGITKEDLK